MSRGAARSGRYRERTAGEHPGDHDTQEHERPWCRVEYAAGLKRKQKLDADEGADDEDLGVGEVDEFQDAVDHRVTERDQRVHEAEQEAVEQDLREDPDEEFEVHGALGGGAPIDLSADAGRRRRG